MDKYDETHLKNMPDSELFIALASPVGTDSAIVYNVLEKALKEFNYIAFKIKISSELLMPSIDTDIDLDNSFNRSNALMDKGNDIRKESGDCGILAQGAMNIIRNLRLEEANKNSNSLEGKKIAYIIDSLKHKNEVKLLREVYSPAFYLFAINEPENERERYLINQKNMGKKDARKLIQRDQDEQYTWGQHTRDVFELADFHISINNSCNKAQTSDNYNVERKMISDNVSIQIRRIIDLMFGCPYHTATFEEYAMFMAYSTALRSGDLSRQVGAVIATDNNEIIAMGTNEVPKFGGGQYWADIVNSDKRGWNVENGRDMMLKRDGSEDIIGYDPNKTEIHKLVNDIVEDTEYFNYDSLSLDEKGLKEYKNNFFNGLYVKLKNLTEFGRTVHAEMSAILSCARLGISLQNSTLFCSTFPCHNCTRHIVYCGIKRIVYIEPYPKSKALMLHGDSTTIENIENRVKFESFTGVGPRRFFDLFSLKLSSGYDIIRKDKNDNVIAWRRGNAQLRCSSNPFHYMDREFKEAWAYKRTTKEKLSLSANK